VARLQIPYVAMHKKGTPQNMHLNPQYENVTLEVLRYLIQKSHQLQQAGIQDIIWDPGFGFGKTIQHNFELMRHLEDLTIHGFPVLAGVSRKSMIWRTLNVQPEEALNGTTALHMLCLAKGASILRVHDVKEAVECVRLWRRMIND
jgi:dihydropteroate synthase